MKDEMIKELGKSTMDKLDKELGVNSSLQNVIKCDCSLLVACDICGEEKGLDGDFWKNKKKHDKLTQEEIEEDCRNIPN